MKKFTFILLFATITVTSYAEYAETFDAKKLFSDLGVEIKPQSSWIETLNAQRVTQAAKKHLPKTKRLPLFCKYPGLQTLPHVSFCNLPTPIEKIDFQNQNICTSVYIKRDDLTGNIEHGTPLYGGNKPRKLEFELGNAVAQGAQAVLTFGCAGSNHAVATSEYAFLLGLHCICMLKPQANSTVVRQNLLLHADNDTELHYYPSNDTRMVGTVCTWLEHKNDTGNFPYVIPTGGSTPLGTVGYVNAVFELQEQIKANLLPEPEYIYVPCGSLATTVGLVLGCKAAGLATQVVGISIEPVEKVDEYYEKIKNLFQATNTLLHEHAATFTLFTLEDNEISINFDFCGPDYGVFTPEGVQAAKALQEIHGISLEGTYTAKAFAALLYDIQKPEYAGKTILFWNTYCGIDYTKRLKNIDYRDLPVCFHTYFEDDVQELDR